MSKKKNLENTRNEIKLSFKSHIEWSDEKLRTTHCTLYFRMLLPKKIAISLGRSQNISLDACALTTCHKNDEYSKEKGIKIALAKAEISAYRMASKLLIKEWAETNTEYLDFTGNNPTVCKEINDFYHKTLRIIEHNQNYIKNL